MPERLCVNCQLEFRPRPQAPKQQYCGEHACQLARRRCWQSKKQRTDADYRDNKRRAQQAWAAAQDAYWRAWRERHPEYCERNRAQQTERNRNRRRSPVIAKTNASAAEVLVPSGIYRLVPGCGVIAKKDAWMIKIAVVAGPDADRAGSAGLIAKTNV